MRAEARASSSIHGACRRAADVLRAADHVIAFTGAGISVESGIPPFRGRGGIWNTYDPSFLEISNFLARPLECWRVIKEIFYDFLGKAKPNAAHGALAKMERSNLLQTVITQNIDNLHREAGSRHLLEFHGNYRQLVCLGCGKSYTASEMNFEHLPPTCCSCREILKPDIVFFGEPIPEPTRLQSFSEAEMADAVIVIGGTGEVMPAALIPRAAKGRGAKIIEVNIEESAFTNEITDIFLQAKATEAMCGLLDALEIGG